MDFEEFDWALIAVVVITALASLIKEVCEYFGVENVEWLILGLKAIAAVLGIIYSVWKFYRHKPYIKTVTSSEWEFDGKDSYRVRVPRSEHKKGKHPSVTASIISINTKKEIYPVIKYDDDGDSVRIVYSQAAHDVELCFK
jgi:hypothetical protein